jgi:hypothetical protein
LEEESHLSSVLVGTSRLYHNKEGRDMMATTHPDVLHIMLGSRVEKQHDDQNSTRQASSNRIVSSTVGKPSLECTFRYIIMATTKTRSRAHAHANEPH